MLEHGGEQPVGLRILMTVVDGVVDHSQDDHPRSERWQQPGHQLRLRVTICPDLCSEQRASRTRPTPPPGPSGRLTSHSVHPCRPKNSSFAAGSARSRQNPSSATSRRPASHAPGVDSNANGTATRSNNPRTGSCPSLVRAAKIADFTGARGCSCHPEPHASPSRICDSTSSYDPSRPFNHLVHQRRRRTPGPRPRAPRGTATSSWPSPPRRS